MQLRVTRIQAHSRPQPNECNRHRQALNPKLYTATTRTTDTPLDGIRFTFIDNYAQAHLLIQWSH